MRVLFLLEFVTRVRTLFIEQLGNALPQAVQQFVIDEPSEKDVSLLIELPLLVFGHRVFLAASSFSYQLSALSSLIRSQLSDFRLSDFRLSDFSFQLYLSLSDVSSLRFG